MEQYTDFSKVRCLDHGFLPRKTKLAKRRDWQKLFGSSAGGKACAQKKPCLPGPPLSLISNLSSWKKLVILNF